MINTKSLVDGISSLSPPIRMRVRAPPPEFVTVKFQSGRLGLLDMKSPRSAVWAEVLQSQRQKNQPVYVEIDPTTKFITELLLPLTVKVGDITPTGTGEDVEVELIISQARHYLRNSHHDFQRLLKTLQTAQKEKTELLVTETLDDHEIIDVRPLTKPKVQRQK